MGAFKYLFNKARRIDKSNNEGQDQSDELKTLLFLSLNLLCEIETVIISKTAQPIANVWSESAMEKRLEKFQNNSSHSIDRFDVDDMDNKFTKLRFTEYLHNMQSAILSRPTRKSMAGRRNNRRRKGKGGNNRHRGGVRLPNNRREKETNKGAKMPKIKKDKKINGNPEKKFRNKQQRNKLLYKVQQ